MKPKVKTKIKKLPQPAPTSKKSIKVRLDYQTVVTISKMSSLKAWLEKYPDAKLISNN
jgi:hypothetical protein